MTEQIRLECLTESSGYLEVPGAHLYAVLHRVQSPVARTLLVGPFAAERQNSYLPWVKWARHLAARGIEVLRFDYRGVGESTGRFEEMTFRSWMEDVRIAAGWFQELTPHVPLVLHGLETGALFAGRCFQDGVGSALLLWSPSPSGNHALRSALLRWVGLEQILSFGAERRKTSDYIQLLNDGQAIEVEGYRWSSALWKDSFQWTLAEGLSTVGDTVLDTVVDGRPVRIANLPSKAAPLVKGGFVGYDEAKDFEWLFREHSRWVEDAVSTAA